jgi:hypothetical protein
MLGGWAWVEKGTKKGPRGERIGKPIVFMDIALTAQYVRKPEEQK